MKTILVSIILALLVVNTSTPIKPKHEEVDIEGILAKSESSFAKASTITKVADKQQKAKMTELHETVNQLVEEKAELQQTLIETTHELQTAKEVINNNVVDTGERFDLFPKD